jgi:hypothetical protein
VTGYPSLYVFPQVRGYFSGAYRWKNGAMAFLAPVAAAVGRAAIMRVGASMLGRAAAGSAAEGAAGGGAESALARTVKSPVMPIPHMGSNGGSNFQPKPEGFSVLNGDQFR